MFTQKSLELIANALSIPMVELFREGESKHGPAVVERFDRQKRKHPDKKKGLILLNQLPEHIVEHYLTLLRMEREILKKNL